MFTSASSLLKNDRVGQESKTPVEVQSSFVAHDDISALGLSSVLVHPVNGPAKQLRPDSLATVGFLNE